MPCTEPNTLVSGHMVQYYYTWVHPRASNQGLFRCSEVRRLLFILALLRHCACMELATRAIIERLVLFMQALGQGSAPLEGVCLLAVATILSRRGAVGGVQERVQRGGRACEAYRTVRATRRWLTSGRH
jgi:hypothetical protein